MSEDQNNKITVEVQVCNSIEKVWLYWTEPEHIKKWNYASEDWHTVKSENNLNVGGKFFSRMEAKDGSIGFDFWGIYDEIVAYKRIKYTLGDGRKVVITFEEEGDCIKITETFEAEQENALILQKNGWQSILNSFKRYAEV